MNAFIRDISAAQKVSRNRLRRLQTMCRTLRDDAVWMGWHELAESFERDLKKVEMLMRGRK